MSTATRIDELRKKFEEHPRRYFAPLANEYRKTGELAQAIALCREHLPKQPGHMSGYIVFGQALFESGALEEARTVFEQALSLDPENLIALRHLGDIAKMNGDASAARRWYERVLDADPRNDDIAAQLATLVTTPTPTPRYSPSLTPSLSMSALGLPAIPTPDASMRAVDFDRVNARIAHHSPLDLEAIEDKERETDAAFDFPGASELEPAATGNAASEEAADDFEEGLIAPEWPDTADLVARVVTARNLTPVDVPITFDEAAAFGREVDDPPLSYYHQRAEAAPITVEESTWTPTPAVTASVTDHEILAAATDEFVNDVDGFDASMMPEAAPAHLTWLVTPPSTEALQWITENDQAVAAHEEREIQEIANAFAQDARGVGDHDAVTVQTVSNTPPAGVETSFADVMDEAPPRDEAVTDLPAFVTETMAELLVAQGFEARAADIYEELARRHPDDQSLHVRLEELRSSLRETSEARVPTPFYNTPVSNTPVSGSPVSGTPAWAAPIPVRTARSTFARLAARRVPRRTPSHPNAAIDEPSDGLSTLFGFAAEPMDDAAARSLADAFAPISAENMSDGTTLNLSFAADTPRSSPALVTAVSDHSAVARAIVPDTSNAFSFDRFFPDPAAATPATDSSVTTSPPAGEDLAEFSAWLKGLGTR